MLWANVIMDTLAAISLGTEKYSKTAAFQRVSRDEKEMVMQSYSWRQIIVQAAYQLLIILFLMYFGVFIFFKPEDRFNIITTELFETTNGQTRATNRLQLDTIIFHTFILMNLFNQINCRIVDSDEKSDINIFRGLESHHQFLMVLAGEFAMQHFMVQWFSGNTILSQIFTVAPISPGANTACYVLGASVLLVNLIVKKIDVNKFKFVKENVSLEKYEPEEQINVIMDSVN